jgi:glutathionylspermidine synthase
MSKCETMVEKSPATPWRCGIPLGPECYRHVLRRAIFDCCKWHTQVNGQPVLCSFPLLLDRSVWNGLTRQAEKLAREVLAAEHELLRRTDLHSELGLPRALRSRLRRTLASGPTNGGVRTMRFDFHWTVEGWRISEANTDVAGGYIEASGVTRLIADHNPGCCPPGDPAGALIAAIRRQLGTGSKVGLMHATVYVEDRQMMLYLAQRLEEQGISAFLFDPTQLVWQQGMAGVANDNYRGPLDLVFRFFPAEWLLHLSARTGWEHLIAGGRTSVCNPGYAVLTQSKRFPLVWDRLATLLPTWRLLLPETRAPDRLHFDDVRGWVLKPALGHEGHNVGIHGVTEESTWRTIRRRARWNSGAWTAQRRFTPLALPTPEGLLYPCLGIYVIDGQAAGAYGRVATRPLIDDRSREIAVLLAPSTAEESTGATRGSL